MTRTLLAVVAAAALLGGCSRPALDLGTDGGAPPVELGPIPDGGAPDDLGSPAGGGAPDDGGAPADAGSSQPWPHEPAGFHVVSDWGFEAITGAGWLNAYPGDDGVTIDSDAMAPWSPSAVMRMHYPVGFTAGISPGTIYLPVNDARELYVALWFKFSNPWQQETMSDVSKLLFIQRPDGNSVVFTMMGPQDGPYYIVGVTELPTSNGHLPNSYGDDPGTRVLTGAGSTDLPVGVWHRLEVYLKYGTSDTSRDGILRWWVDGHSIGDYSTVNFATSVGFAQVSLSPTWGGLDDTKSEDDSLYFDHVRVSAP